jgi:zinc protease
MRMFANSLTALEDVCGRRNLISNSRDATQLILRFVWLSCAVTWIIVAMAGAAYGQEDSIQANPTGVDYGHEVSRFVYEKDEIVATLKNGMVVIVKRVPSPVLAVRGYVKTGGVYEGRWLGGGLSHLLEHLVAGGTNDRRTEAENRDLLQQIGNDSNAYTTSDHTAYYVNTTSENLDKAVDLVTGWMLGAKITQEEYAREYEVVQRELEKGEGEPDRVFYQQTQRNRFQVSPARAPTIGYQEVIQGLSRDDVYEYYKLAYAPNNMVFSLAGDVDPERMLAAVKEHVKHAPLGRLFEQDIAEEPPVLAPRILVSTFPQLGQSKLDLAFPTVKLGHPDMYPLDLLATVLATGESSLLVQELRDRRRLVSSIDASDYTPNYVDGTFHIQMELETSKLAEATKAVLELIEKVKAEGVPEDRLQRAKTQTKTARAFNQQTSENVAEGLATDWLTTGDTHFSERYVERVEKVTSEQIQDVARRFLVAERLLTTAMLPEEDVAPPGGLAAAEAMLRTAAAATADAPQTGGPAKIVKVELSGNLTVLLKRVDQAPIVVISMYSLGGLTAENAQTNGLGNLAMRLATRGTKNRSAQEIAEYFDTIGGAVSGSCGNNTWSITATCLKEDFPRTLDVYADLLHNPVFPDDETELMKRRVLAAIQMQNADWFTGSLRFFRKSYFGPKNSPYQFMTLGSEENVQRFTSEQVRQWYNERVLSSKRVLAVFGDIDVEQAQALVARQFSGGQKIANKTAQHDNRPRQANGPPSLTVRAVKVNKTDNPQAGVMIGFDAEVVAGSDMLYPLTVADTLTSGHNYPTGYIFEILRGRGLVYDAQAFIFPGRSQEFPGALLAYAGCDPQDVNEVTDVILENIARLQGTPEEINTDWFERTKQLIVTSEATNNETASQQAQTAALDELMGMGYDYHDQFGKRIEEVTLDEVRFAARQLLRSCVVTVSTNDPAAVKIKEGLRTYEKFAPVDLTPQGVQHDTK